jgi:hypothetical protein
VSAAAPRRSYYEFADGDWNPADTARGHGRERRLARAMNQDHQKPHVAVHARERAVDPRDTA